MKTRPLLIICLLASSPIVLWAQTPPKDKAPTSVSNSELLLKQFFPDGVRLGADLAFVAAKRPKMHRDDGANRNNVTRFSEGQGDWDRIDTIHYLFIDGVLRGVIREIGTVRKDPENAKLRESVQKQEQSMRDAITKTLKPIESQKVILDAISASPPTTVQLFRDETTGQCVYFHGGERVELIVFDPKFLIRRDFWIPAPDEKQ